jgi:hypothetical protein
MTMTIDPMKTIDVGTAALMLLAGLGTMWSSWRLHAAPGYSLRLIRFTGWLNLGMGLIFLAGAALHRSSPRFHAVPIEVAGAVAFVLAGGGAFHSARRREMTEAGGSQ